MSVGPFGVGFAPIYQAAPYASPVGTSNQPPGGFGHYAPPPSHPHFTPGVPPFYGPYPGGPPPPQGPPPVQQQFNNRGEQVLRPGLVLYIEPPPNGFNALAENPLMGDQLAKRVPPRAGRGRGRGGPGHDEPQGGAGGDDDDPLSMDRLGRTRAERRQMMEDTTSDEGEGTSDDHQGAKYWCDCCQRGFHKEQYYKQHMTNDHIWCDVPGCRFTCVKTKSWKLEIHRTTLHERADAQDLQNSAKYMEQRKRNYPTQERIKKVTAELVYRAARGDVLASDRVLWLRVQGVRLGRKVNNNLNTRMMSRGRGGPIVVPPAPHAFANQVAASGGDPQAPPTPGGGTVGTSALVRPRHMLQQVPSYYVCHRCGRKGQHLVEHCPTIGDNRYDRKFEAANNPRGPVRGGMAKDRSRPIREESEEEGDSDAAPHETSAIEPSHKLRSVEDTQGRPLTVAVDASGDKRLTTSHSDVPLAVEVPISVPACFVPDSSVPRHIRQARKQYRATIALAAQNQYNPAKLQERTLFEKLLIDNIFEDRSYLLQALRFFRVTNWLQDRSVDVGSLAIVDTTSGPDEGLAKS